MQISVALLVLPSSWLIYCMYNLLTNYRQATKIGVPCFVALISPDNQIWIALQTGFPTIFRKIPWASIPLLRHSRLGWEFHDRYRTHQRLGDAFVLVTPAKNWVLVGEAQAADEILTRSRDFDRPVWMTEMLDVFGRSVSTAEGPDWQRQRRLTAPAFNEQKSPLVWAESLRQAGDMLQSWLSHDASGFTSTSDDIRTLALDVLAYTGFQKSYAWRSKKEAAIVDQAMTYRDSLSIILANVLTIVVLSPRFFQLPCLPQRLRRVGVAIKEFKNYMLSQITEERRLEALGHAGSGTLVSNLVRASSEDSQGKSSQMKPLTIDEILGNIFVFNFAGHDTTAISMNYALMLLVARPDIQDWIGEEVKFYLKDGQSATWKYEDSFEKLKRCRAILLETLRLYNPLPGIIKYTSTVQTLKVNGKSLHIPTNTLVVPALQTLHTHPKYWGADSLSWQPERWIRSSPPSSQTQGDTPSILNEELLEPEKGTFIAWSEGMKKCPGKKFAQVEAVAVLARLFRDHRVDPVPMNGCSTAQMLAKVMAAVEDSDVELLLGMRDPRSVSVQWRKT